MKLLNLSGQTFGRLTVINRCANMSKQAAWYCLCSCGNSIYVLAASLRSGSTKSCGCRQKDIATKHGRSKSSEYFAWKSMKDRCYNLNSFAYPAYGGRGITVCDRWKDSFQNFFDDMGIKPSTNLSIDRENNNGNYEKSNCRWATIKQQSRNRSSNVYLTHNNQTLTLSDWSKLTGISSGTLTYRIKQGWSTSKTLDTPPKRHKSSLKAISPR